MAERSKPSGQAKVAQLLAPARSALLVIDVQNDYCHPDGALGRHGADLGSVGPALANIQLLIEAARTAGAVVIFVRNWHEAWANSPGWRARASRQSGAAQANSWGAQFYGVAPAPGEPVIDKQRYDAFIGTPLDSALHALSRDTLVMTGFGTNVCVESTARHAVFLDYRIVFASDATGTADGQAAHEATLETISRHFGPVAATAEIRAAWRGHARRNDIDSTPVARDSTAS
jgi:ureidoacrylate peracid hydrolase